MYEIRKQWSFAASHVLAGLPPDHKCGRLHGHNYTVEIVAQSSTLDATGFVQDYGTFDRFGTYLKDTFDHRHLNDILDAQPSAENLARFLFDRLDLWYPTIQAVRVSETAQTWAEYRRG